MAHVRKRKLPQQPRRYEQRTRGMSKEEKQTLKDLVATYKKAEVCLLDSLQCRVAQSASRMLRNVDTDDLDVDAF